MWLAQLAQSTRYGEPESTRYGEPESTRYGEPPNQPGTGSRNQPGTGSRNQPGTGSRGAAIRRRRIPGFPALSIAYLVLPDRLRIMAVVHTSRRPGYWFDRLAKLNQ